MTIREVNIPRELRRTPNWIGWKHFEVSSKRFRIPVKPSNQDRANVHDCSDWAPFDHAVKAYIRRKIDGIGFVFSGDFRDPYVGIKICNCFDENGKLSMEGRIIFRRLGSYTQLSLSGRSLSIIVKSDFKTEVPVTVYKDYQIHPMKKFFPITGRLFEDSKPEIRDRHSDVMRMVKRATDKVEEPKIIRVPANTKACPICRMPPGIHLQSCPRYVNTVI